MWRSSVEQLRGAGHEVRVLTTDHREERPDPAVDEGPDVYRELRWYWSEHEFPRLSLRERLALERHNLSAFDRHRAEFAPDAVAWWAMGGMSMSLLERGRRAGVPAVGVVIDEWLSYGPLVDGWQRACSRPALARVAEALTGVPTRLDLEGAAEWMFVSAYLRERAVAAGLALGRRGRGPRGDRRGEVPAGAESESGRGRCSAWAGSIRARAPRSRSRRSPDCPAARCVSWAAATKRTATTSARSPATPGSASGCASSAWGATRSPAPTPPRTRCSSAPSGRSRSGSCRSRRWPSARPSSRPGPAARPSTCATRRTASWSRPGSLEPVAAAVEAARRRPRASPPPARRRPRDRGRPRRAEIQRGDRRRDRAGRAMSGPQVTIAVVSWNTRELLERCLESMRADAEAGRAEVVGGRQRLQRRLGGPRPRALRLGRADRERAQPRLRQRRERGRERGPPRRGWRPRTPTSSSYRGRSRPCSPPGTPTPRPAPWLRP